MCAGARFTVGPIEVLVFPNSEVLIFSSAIADMNEGGQNCQCLRRRSSQKRSFVSVGTRRCPRPSVLALGFFSDTSVRSTADILVNLPPVSRPGRDVPDDVIKAYIALVWPRVDRTAYGWKCPDGGFSQISKAKLDAAEVAKFAAFEKRMGATTSVNPHAFIAPLTGKKLKQHLLGQQTFYVRSNWQSRFLLVRFDIDMHDPKTQTDGQALLDWLQGLFNGMLYACPSQNGHSAYAWLGVPMFIDDDGVERPAINKHLMNQRVIDLGHALEAMARPLFKSHIEVHGSFLQKRHFRDENRMPVAPADVVAMSSTCKLPLVSTMADIEKLANAKLHPSGAMVTNVLQKGLRLWNAQQIHKEQTKRELQAFLASCDEIDDGGPAPAPASPRRRGKVSRHLADNGDKLRNTLNVVVRARQLLGIRDRKTLIARGEEVKALAHAIYVENGLGDQNRDRKRDARFVSALRFLIRTFRDVRPGKSAAVKGSAGLDGGKVWFTDDDLKALDTRLRSTISQAELDSANVELKADRQGKLSYGLLCLAAAAMAKNISISAGQVPATSLMGMAAHFALPCSGATMKWAKLLLCAHGIVRRTRGHDAGMKECARWEVLRFHWFAFIPQPEGAETGSTQHAARGAVAAPVALALVPTFLSPGEYYDAAARLAAASRPNTVILPSQHGQLVGFFENIPQQAI